MDEIAPPRRAASEGTREGRSKMTGQGGEDLTRLIPEALKRVRQAAGLRQIDVAAKSGLSKAMVSAYEGGKALPSLPSLGAYLSAIGCNLADLQDALDELGALPKSRTADLEARERAIGRAVLKVWWGLEALFTLTPRFESEDSGQALSTQLPPSDHK